MEIMGHRGAAGMAPENTIPAFNVCKELGVPWVELDVRPTSDGELVLLNDKTLERTTSGKGEVSQMSLEEIRDLDAGSSFSEDFEEVRIPTLGQVLDQFHDSLMFNIELKEGEVRVKEQISRLFQLLDKYQLRHKVILSSFRENVLKALRESDERLRLGITSNQNTEQMKKISMELKCEFLLPSTKILTETLVEWAHDRSKKVVAWTADEPEIVQLLAQMEVDICMTDFPEMAIECLEEVF